MKQMIEAFCEEFSYPSEAICAFCLAWDILAANENSLARFQKNIEAFQEGIFVEDDECLAALDLISEEIPVHAYTLYQLFFISLSEWLRAQYIEENISMEIYRDTVLDLRWKMNETQRVYGIWGVFCGDWFPLHFSRRLYCLGRLEFEISTSEFDYENGGYVLKKGDPLLMVHIPESGSLAHEKALDSYNRAEAFFSEMFHGERLALACESWMLSPDMYPMYPEGNLKTFADDFDTVLNEIHEEEDDRWRIFHMPNDTPIVDYPTDTTLQKRLKEWLLMGNRMKIGTGVFFFHNGNVIPHKEV